ncbi:MAG: VOC family protein [Ferruginibacter sp.]
MNIKGIHHVAILTDDYERSKLFYIDVLGFVVVEETYREERQSYKLDLSINGTYQVELFSFPEFKERSTFPEQKGLRHLAFAVDDIESSVAELIAKGVEVQGIRTDDLTRKRFCFFL